MRFYCWSKMGRIRPFQPCMRNYAKLFSPLVRPCRYAERKMWLLLAMLRGLCVCLCVTHGYNHQSCKNGRTDQCPVFSVNSGVL